MRAFRFALLRFALSLVFIALNAAALSAQATLPQPKREFRGAWIQIINGQFQGMSREQMQRNLTDQLNALQRCGVNAILFQVRGEGDALYESRLEPWSRFLSGTQGVPPAEPWDPLAWMVAQCHARGMELHAWINPFRAKTKGTRALASTHPYVLHPERCFAYDGLYLFDPGLPVNRTYICHVAGDIVRRYDVDGLHIDDYFYPYPAPGVQIPDDASFAHYSNGMTDRAAWRRDNVNRFIKELHDTLRAVKPWVKFGVAPFGIYHNARSGGAVAGSNTSGLQNYDDLYADVLLWVNKGWIDYCIPQVYWEIGHAAADYDTLVRWWSRHAAARPLFIGQDVERTVRAASLTNPATNQMDDKFRLQRTLPGIGGSCLWYSAAVARNEGGYATALTARYHRTPALQPLFPFLEGGAPSKVRSVKARWMPDGYYLFWREPKASRKAGQARQYVVYRFSRGEKVDLESAAHIVAVTPHTLLRLPYAEGKARYTYVVTALDRLANESKAKRAKVKL